MRRFAALVATVGVAFAFPGAAGAKTEANAPAVLRCARSYAEAMAEAKDRGCVVFATFHADG
jgi:hypothetical protein